ncbi:MAG TPA: hypothetical protein VK178_12045 [Opitutaceae bacterium]|nr:hypothetical protein [Opitutaceae bacterium]
MQHARLLLGLAAATLVALGWLAHATCRCAGSWNRAAWANAMSPAELRSLAARDDAAAEDGSFPPTAAIHRHRPARPLTRVWWPDGVLAGTTELDTEWFRFAAGTRPLARTTAWARWQFGYGAGAGVVLAMRQQGALEFMARVPAAEADETPFAKRAECDYSAAATTIADPVTGRVCRSSVQRHRF